MKNLITYLGKIPVNNFFLSQILKQTDFKNKIKKDFPRDYVLEFWLSYFKTEKCKASLVFVKDIDWHTDSDLKNKIHFHNSLVWVLKTKNSKLLIKDTDNRIESLDLKKGMLINFQNYKKHSLVSEENNVSCFLVIDFIKKSSSLKYYTLKLENFKNYIQSGNSIR